MEPLTDYAHSGDQQIAYQVVGDGPIDLMITNGFWGSFDVEWDDPMVGTTSGGSRSTSPPG